MFLSLQEYLLGATKLLALYGYNCHKNDEDAIAYVADAMMRADNTWDEKSSGRDTWRYNQAKYAILHLKAKHRKKKKIISLDTEIGRAGTKSVFLKDIITAKEKDDSHKELFENVMNVASNKLTARELECISLYYTGDLTLAKIGKQLGISKQAVSQHIHRAMKVLQYECKFKPNHITS